MSDFSIKKTTTISVPYDFAKKIQEFYGFLDEHRLLDDVGYIFDAMAEDTTVVTCDKAYGEIYIDYIHDINK